MKKIFGNGLYTIVLSFLLTSFCVTGALSMGPDTTILKAVLIENNKESIKSVDMDFKETSFLLNVHLSKPLSCRQIIKVLGIRSLPINDKTYSPSCSIVTNDLVQIVYAIR